MVSPCRDGQHSCILVFREAVFNERPFLLEAMARQSFYTLGSDPKA